jgi:CheY-like chemotaxis protein
VANVLIVEDDADTAELLALALGRAGHSVEKATNGQEALGAVVGRPHDLIVLDVHMPVMDGPTFLGLLRSYLNDAKIPVVVVTAAEQEQIDRVAGLGVARVFAKANFRIADLLKTVQSLTASP